MDIYEKFMRNELTILTVIANIGALVSTFKTIFIFVLPILFKKL